MPKLPHMLMRIARRPYTCDELDRTACQERSSMGAGILERMLDRNSYDRLLTLEHAVLDILRLHSFRTLTVAVVGGVTRAAQCNTSSGRGKFHGLTAASG